MQTSSEASAVPGLPPESRAEDTIARKHDPQTRADQLLLLAAALLTALLLARAVTFWPFTLDDAYITLRYSRHLAQGLGPSWNPGAAPAEGYTTVLWMLLLSLAEFLHIDGPWFAKAIGVVFALASFVSSAMLALRASRASGLSVHAQWFAIAAVLSLFVSYWPIGLHAVSGMETTLSCYVLTAFFLQSTTLDGLPDSADARSVFRKLALAGLACCLTRPEAVLPCAVTLLAHLISKRSDRARRWQLFRTCSLWLALPYAAYYGLRWYHFDLLFPLSFYVKATGQPLFAGLPNVLDFFAPFVVEQPWWGFLIVLGALRTRMLRPSLLGALSLVLFFIFPEHIMAFEGRYLLPLFPLLAAAGALGVAQLSEHLLRARAGRVRLALGMLSLCLLAALPLPGNRTARAQQWLDYGHNLRAAHVALARDLSSAKDQGGRIALLDVGAVGYYADWYTIDTFGLNDAHVALTRRTDVAYVLAQRPDLLVLVSAQPGHFKEVFEWETPLYEAARRENYQTLCHYEFEPDYFLHVLGRGDSAAIRGNVCSSAARFSSD